MNEVNFKPDPDLPPLIRFSFYTFVQFQSLANMAKKLEAISDKWEDNVIDDLQDYYDFFWLWVLGGYEVLRTMDEHSDCFSDEIARETKQLKKEFSRIRMPFAKQELRYQKGPIFNENSFSSIGYDGMVFAIEGQDLNSKALIRDLLDHLASIGPNDILKEIPTAIGTQASSVTPPPGR